jgi:hypothetical protein
MLMTWKQAIGRVAPVCMLLAGCSMGNPSTVVDRTTLGKGQRVTYYRLENVDSQGRAEFRMCSPIDGSLVANEPPTVIAPGQTFGCTIERKGKLVDYGYTVESTDPAKQQATVLAKVTTTPK